MRWPALAVLLAAAACVSRTPFADTDYPGTLLPAGSLPHDLVWQQRVTAAWGLMRGDPEHRGERGFDAAIQKQGDVLTVVGLSPLGSVGFTLKLDNTTLSVRNDSGEDLPFPARFVLLDVQRTFYPWLGAPLKNGTRSGPVFDEDVTETWADGRLVERRFARRDGKPAGAITITYDWIGIDPTGHGPRRAVLHNDWFDYRLTVDIHAETKLSPPSK